MKQRVMAAVIALVACIGFAHAQAYPTKPVRMLVGYAPGGGMDALSRIVAGRLSDVLGQQVIIENRPGAGATLAADAAARAPSDGYTLHMAETGLLIAPAMYPKLPFDVLKAFLPIAGVASLPLALVVNPAISAKSTQELVLLLRQSGTPQTYGSPGVGTLQHLAFELFLRQVGARATHVPYKGATPMIPDLVSGQITIGIVSVSAALGQSRAGRLRTVAVTGARRLPNAPEWPTLAESLPGFDAAPRVFLLAPAGTPEAVALRLAEALQVTLAAREVVEALANQGASPEWSPSPVLAAQMADEARRWTTAAREAGIRPE